MFEVMLSGLASVMLRVKVVGVSRVRVMRGFFVTARLVMRSRVMMMFGGVFMMLGGFAMMFGGLFRHSYILLATELGG